MKTISFQLNGKKQEIHADPEEPLLYVLREDLDLKGAKFGCGLQQCGACMVLVDDKNEPSCLSPCENFEGKNIETIEGLMQNNQLHAVQKTFIDLQAAQCGYCLNGMLISAVALLRANNNPSDQDIREALDPVICRCGTHSRFIKAVKKVSSSNI